MFNLVLDFILYPIDEGGLKPTLQTYENQEGGLKHSGVFPTGTLPCKYHGEYKCVKPRRGTSKFFEAALNEFKVPDRFHWLQQLLFF
jgi:hypothetical protein